MADRIVSISKADGTSSHLLTNPAATVDKFNLMRAPTLWGAPELRYQEQAFVNTPGVELTAIAHKARDIVLPLKLIAGDTDDAETYLDAFLAMADPIMSGQVRLTVTRPDAEVRIINASVIGGLGGVSINHKKANLVSVILVLRAPDPYWLAVSDESGSESSPFTPVVSGFSEASQPWSEGFFNGYIGSDTATSDGDALPFWPTWTIEGPATAATMRQTISGGAISWNGSIVNGETLTIVTDPATRSATVDGVNVWTQITADSVFQPLTGGVAYSVSYGIAGDDANTTISWTATPKFLQC